MKKTTLLNSLLSSLIAEMGHTDALVICDAGLPIPSSVVRIDLAISKNIPTFLQTLQAINSELFVERAVIAQEIKEYNSEIYKSLINELLELSEVQNNKIIIEYVTHDELKGLTNNAKGIIRTGECSPYANVILYSGVPF